MGRKLDLSGLTDNESAHVLQVVQRDMKLRQKEEKRLCELKQELDDEGTRCLLLSRQSCFNQRCCIRCCSPFTFLLNPKRQCLVCRYNVCRACRVYSRPDKAWLCTACQKSRQLKTQSLEWFYTNVKIRFKRFGSAKVLKTLYRKHLAEQSAFSDFNEGSAYEESICNEGSICGSDSTFYRQIEEHSMTETLTVALRVAEEAIDEAISKAEFDTASQEKQNEAHYLREHRGELIEELAQTIVQKIISRKKTVAERRSDYDQDWPFKQNAEPHHRHHRHRSTSDQASSSVKSHPGLWRSHSVFSLLEHSEPPGPTDDSLRTAKKEGGGSIVSAWKSVDWLDNAVLKSPDGNWIALQSAQLTRPSRLTKRKSLVYSALERESGVVSAYEGMDPDNETEPYSSWGSALQEIHRKMADCNFNLQDTRDVAPSPLPGRRGSGDDAFSDSEGNRKPNKPLLIKRKVPAEIRRSSASQRTSIIDMNFNVEAATGGEDKEGSVAAEAEVGRVRRSRRKRKNKKEQDLNQSNSHHSQPSSDTLTCGTTTPESTDFDFDRTGDGANLMDEITLKIQRFSGRVSDSVSHEEDVGEDRESGDDGEEEEEERRQGREEGDEGDERNTEMDLDEERMEDDREEEQRDLEVDEEINCRLYRLVTQSRLQYLSSTDDELDKVGQGEGQGDGEVDDDGGERQEEKTEGLSFKLCQLEKEVRATLFSSTEDELDRAGRDEERGAGEETPWKLQEEKVAQATRLRDLASLVSASQFSSTEDELDRVEKNGGEPEQSADGGGTDSSFEMEEVWGVGGGAVARRESFGDLDVKMFDLRDETEEAADAENVLADPMETDNVRRDQSEMGDPEKRGHSGETVTGEIEGGFIGAEEETREDEKRHAKAEKTYELDRNNTRAERVNQQEADGSEEEKGQESNVAQGEWEATADSGEEDAEFDRIISSMLMMTLEDMQGPTSEGGTTRIQAETEESEARGAPEETRSDVAIQSRGARGETGETDNAQVGEGHEPEDRDAGVEGGNVGQRGFRRAGGDDEERQAGRGTSANQGEMTQAATSEGQFKSKDMEENKESERRSPSSPREGFLSPEEIERRYSAVSLRGITTEVLKVLNATEELLQGADGGGRVRLSSTSLPPNTDPQMLDQRFSRLEENVYVAAGSVYSLEAELSDLEECARGICSSTSDLELSFLEEQMATAAAKVQQSELQICDISARIAALKRSGLNVDTQSRLTKNRTIPVMPVTLDSTRQVRRRLPAPPVKEDKET